jgi:hypothetical protein
MTSDDTTPSDGSEEPETVGEGRVLAPDELDIERSERVLGLGDGRYVVSTGEDPPTWEGDTPPTSPSGEGSEEAEQPEQDEPLDRSTAREVLLESLSATGARYCVDAVARFDGTPANTRTVTGDVVTAFEDLIGWYARQASRDTPVEEVLAVLLNASRYGPYIERRALRRRLDRAGLGPDDPIGALLDALASDSQR